VHDAQAKQQQSEVAAAKQKEAVQALAEQLVSSGKQGVSLNSRYALLQAPAALKEAAYAVFARQAKELGETHLKSSVEPFIRQLLGIEKQAKPTQEDYGRIQEIDSLKTRQEIADYSMETLNHEVSKKWGVTLSTDSSLYLDLARKALKTVNELTARIIQEVKKALGLDEPQQHRGRGLGR
jgi:hypothetical protein